MAKRLFIAVLLLLAPAAGAMAWIALEPGRLPAQPSANEQQDTGCDSDSTQTVVGIRWSGGG